MSQSTFLPSLNNSDEKRFWKIQKAVALPLSYPLGLHLLPNRWDGTWTASHTWDSSMVAKADKDSHKAGAAQGVPPFSGGKSCWLPSTPTSVSNTLCHKYPQTLWQ